jgi:ribonucleoside-diphosphate reductase alpha chain
MATTTTEYPQLASKNLQTVINRHSQEIPFDVKIMEARVTELAFGLHEQCVNPKSVIEKTISGLYNKIQTVDLDDLMAETCAYMNMIHPDYSILASRISVTKLHRETLDTFWGTAQTLYNYVEGDRNSALLSDEVFKVISDNKDLIESRIDYTRDLGYDFFGYKTLEKSYLLRCHGKVVERPQDLLMRVSIGIHLTDLDSVFQTYDLMSQRIFTHATPTLFNAGTKNPQMSSCFLLTMKEDSISGIYDTLKQCALISKSAGGIGVAISNIRATGSYIRGTNGNSNGIVPMLRVFNDTARYVDQGGGKRKGSFAIYLEPWHADIFDWLLLRRNHGKEELRARDLFYAVWTPDLFMRRVEANEDWTLMCPNRCPGLVDVYGEEFEALYMKYESEGKGIKVVKARTIWTEIIKSQIETGTPYMLYKDAANKKSNQKNIGTIKSSNLCTEIMEYTAPDEVAVCNLASIALPKFVDLETNTYNFAELEKVASIITKNLNRVIDRNYYPVPEAKKSNFRHRPIGIGVQGLADAYAMLKINFDSPEAEDLNIRIFETIYYGAVKSSMEIAKVEGHYETFPGSPASKGELQFDMWGVQPRQYDWTQLKKDVVQYGIRNSLLIAPMPTASTSQILGNTESFEAITANIYTRRVLSGDFICINKHLVKDLISLVFFSKTKQFRNCGPRS